MYWHYLPPHLAFCQVKVSLPHFGPRHNLALLTRLESGPCQLLAVSSGCCDPISLPILSSGQQDAPAWQGCPNGSAQGKEDWPDLSVEPALPSMTSCSCHLAPESGGRCRGAGQGEALPAFQEVV